MSDLLVDLSSPGLPIEAPGAPHISYSTLDTNQRDLDKGKGMAILGIKPKTLDWTSDALPLSHMALGLRGWSL